MSQEFELTNRENINNITEDHSMPADENALRNEPNENEIGGNTGGY